MFGKNGGFCKRKKCVKVGVQNMKILVVGAGRCRYVGHTNGVKSAKGGKFDGNYSIIS